MYCYTTTVKWNSKAIGQAAAVQDMLTLHFNENTVDNKCIRQAAAVEISLLYTPTAVQWKSESYRTNSCCSNMLTLHINDSTVEK